MPRVELGIVVQFVTAHCWFQRHLNIIDGLTPKECRLCGADGNTYDSSETPIHLATTCPETAQIRLFPNHYQNSNNQVQNAKYSWDPAQICEFASNTTITLLNGLTHDIVNTSPDEDPSMVHSTESTEDESEGD